jgi:hypothetical protein
MTLCPKCGMPVRYIAASRAGGNEMFAVDPLPRTLISERGRVLTGFTEHKCPEHLPWLKEGQEYAVEQ